MRLKVFLKDKKMKIDRRGGVIKIFSRVDEVDKVIREIGSGAKNEGYGVIKRRNLISALYEALTNAIIHGNRGNGSLKVVVAYAFNDNELEIRVADQGDGFDISSRGYFPGGILRQAGKGIFFIENFMDRVFFNEKGNEITMILKKVQNDISQQRVMRVYQ